MGSQKSDFFESRNFIFESDLTSFIDCPILRNHSQVPIYVSSDSSYVKDIIRNMAHTRKVISFSSKANHSDRISAINNFQKFSEPFLELLLLGHCNELIGTFGSTFSVLAASTNGKLPYLVPRNSSCFLPSGYFY